MASKCDPIRSQLYALEDQLKKTPMFLTEQTQGQNVQSQPMLNPQWTNLDDHVRRTRVSLQVCEESD